MISQLIKQTKLITTGLLILGFFLSGFGATLKADSTQYTLETGDQFKVSIFNEEDLSFSGPVDSKGNINYPLIGKLSVSGLTLDELSTLVEDKMRGDYLVNPIISVSMVRYRSVYASGEVKAPGEYEYKPGMTVRQLIMLAGDLTENASKRKIYLLPNNASSSDSIKIQLDQTISPGDTIQVKEGFF